MRKEMQAWQENRQGNVDVMNVYDVSVSISDCALDLVFVIDNSGSIRDTNPEDGSYDNWQLLINFIKSAITKFLIGPKDTRVSIVLFSTEATLEFTLNQAETEAEVLALVDGLPYIGGWTNTADALKVAAEREQFC